MYPDLEVFYENNWVMVFLYPIFLVIYLFSFVFNFYYNSFSFPFVYLFVFCFIYVLFSSFVVKKTYGDDVASVISSNSFVIIIMIVSFIPLFLVINNYGLFSFMFVFMFLLHFSFVFVGDFFLICFLRSL